MKELLDVIDENERNTGIIKERKKIHLDGDWHKAAHLWIIKDARILLQKRSSEKKIFPNRFDVSCAGHVSAGENYKDSIIRELKEELGIDVNEDALIFLEKRKQITKYKNLISREIIAVFLLRYNGKMNELKIDKKEVSEVRLFTIKELRKLLKETPEMFVNDKKYFFDTLEKIEVMFMEDS